MCQESGVYHSVFGVDYLIRIDDRSGKIDGVQVQLVGKLSLNPNFPSVSFFSMVGFFL